MDGLKVSDHEEAPWIQREFDDLVSSFLTEHPRPDDFDEFVAVLSKSATVDENSIHFDEVRGLTVGIIQVPDSSLEGSFSYDGSRYNVTFADKSNSDALAMRHISFAFDGSDGWPHHVTAAVQHHPDTSKPIENLGDDEERLLGWNLESADGSTVAKAIVCRKLSRGAISIGRARVVADQQMLPLSEARYVSWLQALEFAIARR